MQPSAGGAQPAGPGVGRSDRSGREPVSTGADWRALHIWQIQPVRDVLLLVAILAVVYLGYVLSVVTVPMLLAMALAYLFEPLVHIITRQGRGPIGRPGAAIGLILGVLLVVLVPVGLGITFGILQGSSVVKQLANSTQLVVESAEAPDDGVLQGRVNELGPRWIKLRDSIVKIRVEAERAKNKADGQAVDQPPDFVSVQAYAAFEGISQWVQENSGNLSKQAFATGAGAVGVALALVGSLGYIVFTGFLTAIFFFFFCTSWGRVLAFWKGLIPEKRQGPVIDMLKQMDAVIAGFIRGRLLICGICMLWFTAGYTLIGVPAPLIMGPAVGLLCIIPYASGIGIPVSILLMWLDPNLTGWQAQWWWVVGAPLAIHGLNQLLDDYILTPRIQGKSTNMDTPTILFASMAGGVLAGFYGLLLAIPVVACVKIVLKRVVMPRVEAWAKGTANDPLPFGSSR